MVRSPRAGNFPSFIPPSLLFRCDGAVHLSAYCARSDLWDDNYGQLAFANMEDIAKTATPVNDLGQLNPYHVDAALLHQQEAHFVYTDHHLAWVNYEGRAKAGKIGRGLPDKPSAIPRPPLKL